MLYWCRRARCPFVGRCSRRWLIAERCSMGCRSASCAPIHKMVCNMAGSSLTPRRASLSSSFRHTCTHTMHAACDHATMDASAMPADWKGDSVSFTLSWKSLLPTLASSIMLSSTSPETWPLVSVSHISTKFLRLVTGLSNTASFVRIERFSAQ